MRGWREIQRGWGTDRQTNIIRLTETSRREERDRDNVEVGDMHRGGGGQTDTHSQTNRDKQT